MDTSSTNFLHIGDYITLSDVKFEGNSHYLYTEGILSEDLFVKSDSKPFDDMVFCVQLMRQYSASKELEDFLLLHPNSSDLDDPSLGFLHFKFYEHFPLS